MFGLQFLFAAGLWALPLAGLPILLHLLFRQKSPVIAFSTLRFIRLSVQRTAARRRIQKWLLLACRALLVGLLIWAIAQPAKKLASGWFGGGRSVAVAVVVDTSYSMLLKDGEITLLSRADGMVEDLLRQQLAGAKVAVFESAPVQGRPEELQDAAGILAGWSPLKAQGSPQPLIERVTSAIALLERQRADQKWLIILSDFQSNEFGRPIGQLADGHEVLIDLHPSEPRSAGVTSISVKPEQPIPGVEGEAVVEMRGRAGESRAVVLKTSSVDGSAIDQSSPVMASFDAGGKGVARFPLKFPAERWVMLSGALTADDAMMWDNQRSELIEIPAKRKVTVISEDGPAARFVRLALDPNEGKLSDWPMTVSAAARLSGREDTAVVILTKWPGTGEAQALRDFARRGGNVVLFLQPGLEQSWATLSPASQAALLDLLPAAPVEGPAVMRRVAIGDAGDPLLEGLTDDKYQLGAIVVRRMVPMVGEIPAVLNTVAIDPVAASRPIGLLFRKPVGAGVCFTIATSLDSALTNFATHPTFLPLLVRMALWKPVETKTLNVELGQPLVLQEEKLSGESQMLIQTPGGAEYRVTGSEGNAGKQFSFLEASEPGLYRWRKVNGDQTVAMTNVQLPAAESDLNYRPAETIAARDALVANSVVDLQTKLGKLNEPQPKWSLPIAIVLMLLCVEALMGSGARGISARLSRT